MADLFNFDDEASAYELPSDSFSQPGSSYLDLGGFTYTPEASGPLMQTTEEMSWPNLDLGGFTPVAEDSAPLMLTSQEQAGDSDWLGKLKKIGSAAGLVKPDGSYDWSKVIGLSAAGLTAYDTLTQAPSAAPKSAAQLLAGLPSNVPGGFSPDALAAMRVPMKAGNQLARQYAADMPSPIRPGTRGYAEGGEVDGPLSQTFDSSQTQGFVGAGEGGGQDDMIDARLSPGEYVFDAESVSMLGDGDNAAGARKLDELREAMRAHKRSAPPDEIAPKAQGPLSYMKGGLNG